MNVLFVCSRNVGRSQMATSIFNSVVHGNGHADSAGTVVGEKSSQTIGERAVDSPGAHDVIEAMQELGVDITDSKRTQLTKDMLVEYDKVIVMADADTIPDWLNNSDKYEYWEIFDPRFSGLDETRRIRDEIKTRISKLIAA